MKLICQSTEQTERTNRSRLLKSSIRKTAKVGTPLELFQHILWNEQFRIVGFSVPWSCRQQTGGLYPTRNQNGVGGLQSEDCDDVFNAEPIGNFFPRTCCFKHNKHDMREPGIFTEEFRCIEIFCLCNKRHYCHDLTSSKFKLSSRNLNKPVLEQVGDGPLEKYYRVLTKKWILRQLTEVSTQPITLMRRMDKFKKNSPTLIGKEM